MNIDLNSEQVLCLLTDIADGKSRGFLTEHRQDRVLAVRKGDQVFVYMNSCPHEWAPMELRKDYFLTGTGQEIMCYAHNAHFQIETGLCVSGPCLHKALITVPHRIEAGAVIIPLQLPEVPATRRWG